MSGKHKRGGAISRRDFLHSSALAAGAGLMLARSAMAQGAGSAATRAGASDTVNVALIGVGQQGKILLDAARPIPGVRFRAVCDIWDYNRDFTQRRLRAYGHEANAYVDYREMLDKEKDLDAVLVATPDWVHAEHTNACLEAGLHVYCEKEMANTLDKARSMVETQRRTGKLLQIGHQRRSNPRYIHAIDKLIHGERLLGRVTHAYGQWNRAKQDDLSVSPRIAIPPEVLKQYGYDTMQQFLNWRWYKKFGGGPIVDLGSHQIDIFSWVFGRNPKSVIASGGVDFYQHHEWYDNVLTIYEYENDEGTARAFYQVLTTTSHGGFSEVFMGEDGSIEISEVPSRGNVARPEVQALQASPKWDLAARKGLLRKERAAIKPAATKSVEVDIRDTEVLGGWPFPIEMTWLAHQPHLENFFNAIRYGEKLTCPAEIGYETAVAVLRANDAVAAGRRLEFKEEDFHA